MLHECFSIRFALGDVSNSSPLYKQIKEEMVEKDAKIRDLESKLLVGRKVQHLGCDMEMVCDMEIQTLKSIIVDLQKELQGPFFVTMVIPVIPNETELMEEKKEK